MFLKHRALLIAILYSLWGIGQMQAQENILSADSPMPPIEIYQSDTLLHPLTDTLKIDTLAVTDTVTRKQSVLEAPVTYQAVDSIVLTAGNMAYLYGQGDVKYQQIQLQSEMIEMSMDSTVVYAIYGVDSTGIEFGYPLFIEGDQQVEAKTMRYNFKTKKAFAKDVLTQQGEGFLTAGTTKKMADNSMNMINGQYTTCDEHDHPHFYIRMTKAKVRPGKNIVAGPAYLVIEDVPLYLLGLPFGFFPFSSTYSSGIIMPTYGDEMTQGFYLRDGGYYFALSDHVDLALRGEVYTKGSWGASARSAYKKRYKYSGNFDAAYQVTKLGEKDFPDYQVAKAFRINWTHTQDTKANPYRTFSAGVNFSTNQFDRNNIKQQVMPSSTENNKGSSISMSQRFPNSPWNISATMRIDQRSSDSSLYVNLPNLMLTMSKIYPLKRKNAIGSERWYEKISMSYTGNLQNSISAKENEILQKNIIKDWQNGMEHRIPVSATYTAFGYLNISPSFNYHERWHTNKVYQQYDTLQNRLAPVDTTYGFYRVYDYNVSISASTTLYGTYIPWKIFGGYVNRIRHRMEPSISFSATPDFGSSKYGYYQDYSYTRYEETVYNSYSFFPNAPGRGKQGNISFNLANNIEAKIRSDQDSSGLKKISLIDNLSFGMSYNLAADSFQWSNLAVGLRLKLSKSYTLNLNGTFDTYTYNYRETTRNNEIIKIPYKVDKPRWEAGKGIGRLRSTGTNFSYTFNNDTFKKWFGGKDKSEGKTSNSDNLQDEDDPDNDQEENSPTVGKRLREPKKNQSGDYDEDGYYIASVPWSFTFSYGLNLDYNTNSFNFDKLEYDYLLRHSLSFNGNIQPTKNWRINFNSSYDFEQKKIPYMALNISRDLHCFQMSVSAVPVGYRKSYMFSIAVNSSLLKDLKYNQSSSMYSGQTWY